MAHDSKWSRRTSHPVLHPWIPYAWRVIKKWNKTKNSFWKIIKKERKKETNLWVLANKVPGDYEKGSILPWKLHDFLVEDHSIVSMCPDVTTLIPLISQHNFIMTVLKALCLQQNNNRMLYTLYAMRCQVTDDPMQGLSTTWPYHHKQRQFEAQCMGKHMTLKQQIYLCATLCVLGPRGFSKPLMVFNFTHC